MELLSSPTVTVLELACQTVHLSHVYGFFQKKMKGGVCSPVGRRGAMGQRNADPHTKDEASGPEFRGWGSVTEAPGLDPGDLGEGRAAVQ